MLIVPTLIWFVENLIFGKIMVFSPYFRMLYAFLLVLLSITEINYKITHENKQLYRSPKFILSIGLILFFVYQILYEWALSVEPDRGTHQDQWNHQFTILLTSMPSQISFLE